MASISNVGPANGSYDVNEYDGYNFYTSSRPIEDDGRPSPRGDKRPDIPLSAQRSGSSNNAMVFQMNRSVSQNDDMYFDSGYRGGGGGSDQATPTPRSAVSRNPYAINNNSNLNGPTSTTDANNIIQFATDNSFAASETTGHAHPAGGRQCFTPTPLMFNLAAVRAVSSTTTTPRAYEGGGTRGAGGSALLSTSRIETEVCGNDDITVSVKTRVRSAQRNSPGASNCQSPSDSMTYHQHLSPRSVGASEGAMPTPRGMPDPSQLPLPPAPVAAQQADGRTEQYQQELQDDDSATCSQDYGHSRRLHLQAPTDYGLTTSMPYNNNNNTNNNNFYHNNNNFNNNNNTGCTQYHDPQQLQRPASYGYANQPVYHSQPTPYYDCSGNIMMPGTTASTMYPAQSGYYSYGGDGQGTAVFTQQRPAAATFIPPQQQQQQHTHPVPPVQIPQQQYGGAAPYYSQSPAYVYEQRQAPPPPPQQQQQHYNHGYTHSSHPNHNHSLLHTLPPQHNDGNSTVPSSTSTPKPRHQPKHKLPHGAKKAEVPAATTTTTTTTTAPETVDHTAPIAGFVVVKGKCEGARYATHLSRAELPLGSHVLVEADRGEHIGVVVRHLTLPEMISDCLALLKISSPPPDDPSNDTRTSALGEEGTTDTDPAPQTAPQSLVFNDTQVFTKSMDGTGTSNDVVAETEDAQRQQLESVVYRVKDWPWVIRRASPRDIQKLGELRAAEEEVFGVASAIVAHCAVNCHGNKKQHKQQTSEEGSEDRNSGDEKTSTMPAGGGGDNNNNNVSALSSNSNNDNNINNNDKNDNHSDTQKEEPAVDAALLMDCEYQLTGQKLTLYVSRPHLDVFVNFRRMQRKLYRTFRCRIWMAYVDEVADDVNCPEHAAYLQARRKMREESRSNNEPGI